jgi:hypothetical protein
MSLRPAQCADFLEINAQKSDGGDRRATPKLRGFDVSCRSDSLALQTAVIAVQSL